VKKILQLAFLLVMSIVTRGQSFTWSGYAHIADQQTINIPINVSGLQSSIDTNFGVAHVCLDIMHSYNSDLEISLISPGGTTVMLIQGTGGSSNNFLGTCLGMDGTAFTNAQAPYTGIFYPAGNVASFNNGQNPNGTWTLVIHDIATPDTGYISSAYIVFTNNPPRQVASSGNGVPVGNYVCATCICPPDAGEFGCDLLPDMTASAKEILENHVEEPGFLYISNATPNIGYGPLDIYGVDSCFCGTTHVPCNTICPSGEPVKHVVKQRVYHKRFGQDTLSYYDRLAGKMTFHIQHGHLHVDNWANYSLRSATSNPDARTWPIIAPGTKQSFCLINLGNCANNPGECVDNNGNNVLTAPNHNVGWHTGCGLNQGIYPGNYDVYSVNLNDPIPLQNVCNGNYYIVSITDPDDNFLESDESNNWIAVPITLTQQNVTPTINPNGSTSICPGSTVTLTSSPASNYLWSNGATTQSITVGTAGTYTVSSNCGTATMTSQPITVTVIPANAVVTAAISISNGSNPTCPGVSIIFDATVTNGGSSPTYQWKVNGSNVGTNSPTYTTTSLTNGQVVTCVVTSNISCLAGAPATSNAITMIVTPPAAPAVNIALSTGVNPQCSGDEVIFTATAANATNTSYQWLLNGNNTGTNSNTYASSSLTNGQTIRCNITANSNCPLTRVLGTGTGLNDYRSDLGAAYPTYYGNGRQQYLVLASELSGLGLSAGNINSLGFNVAGVVTGNPSTLNGYTIKMGLSPVTFLTGAFQAPAFTTVFGPVNYKPTLATVNTHLFSTPFYWDGTSNIIVDICFSNQVTGSAAYQTYQTPTAFVSTTYYQADGAGGSIACTRTTGPNSGSMRPNMIFTVAPQSTASSNIITMGVNSGNTYTFTGSGNWNVATNWLNNSIPPPTLPSCGKIIIDPIAGQECILNVTQTIAAGGKIIVKNSKKFRIPGNLIQQ